MGYEITMLDDTTESVSEADGYGQEGPLTTFGYDGRKNRTSRTNALAGLDTSTYTLADQVATTKDPLNRQTQYGYDTAGRLAECQVLNSATIARPTSASVAITAS